jgi:protein ImuB
MGLTEAAPLALSVPGTHGPLVHAATRAAEAVGAVPGLRVVDVRAVCPDLRVEEADTAGDAIALARLMLWSRRWCPWTAVEEVGGPGLVMDVTGSAQLWGGEAALMAEVEGRLASLGLTARLAVAPTRGAAWALARFAGPHADCGPNQVEAMTAPLPVRALRLSDGTVPLLRRLGLKTVGDLLAVPRLSLARRFARAKPGDDPLLRLDQLTGRVPEPLHCPDDPPRFVARAALAEPVEDPTPLLPALARNLCAMLVEREFGARRLLLTIYRSDGEASAVEVATSRAARDPLHLARLFDGRLDRLDPGFGFDLVTLAATVAERLPPGQPSLDGKGGEGEDLARLVDRLSARFGARALRRPALRESHLPERREAWVPVLGGTPPAPPPLPHGSDRPLRLFDPPEEVRVTYVLPEGPPMQFVWRRATHRVVRFAGPERIAPEWWRERPGTRLRDYFKVEDHEGRRFWLFREGVSNDGRGGAPRWLMHGACA